MLVSLFLHQLAGLVRFHESALSCVQSDLRLLALDCPYQSGLHFALFEEARDEWQTRFGARLLATPTRIGHQVHQME